VDDGQTPPAAARPPVAALGALRAVVFDIGGVLEMTPETGWREEWAARLGLEPTELVWRLEPTFRGGDLGTVPLAEIEQQAALLLGLDETEAWQFMETIWAEYLGTLNDELVRYFSALRPRYRTGILSNSFVGARERERAAYGLEDLCDVIVYSHEEGVKKPDPRAYRIVCERLGVEPTETVFLDDVPACVEGARAVGMQAVRFVNNRQAITELESVLGRARRAARPPNGAGR
jgi:epoxide hydrolase-like predicted phosphatase